MPGFTLTKQVDAPVETVFDIASDLERLPEVIEGITKMEVVTEGPVGVGTRFRETRVMMKREHTEEMEITRFDRPGGYRSVAHNCGCRYDTDFLFTDDGKGGCQIEMRFEATPLRLVARLMGFLMGFMMNSCKKLTEKDLDDIKAAAETRARAGQEPAI